MCVLLGFFVGKDRKMLLTIFKQLYALIASLPLAISQYPIGGVASQVNGGT